MRMSELCLAGRVGKIGSTGGSSRQREGRHEDTFYKSRIEKTLTKARGNPESIV